MWNFRLLTFYLFLADRLAFLDHFLCVPKVVQLIEIDSEIEDIIWPRGDADSPANSHDSGVGLKIFLTFLTASRQDSQSHGFLGNIILKT